jgi:hypothetical protein
MRESAIERKVANWARAIGVPNCKLDVRANAGFPDRIFFVPGGRPVIIEFKAPGESPRILQEYYIDELKKRSYNVQSCDSSDGAMAVISRAVEAAYRAKAHGKKRN